MLCSERFMTDPTFAKVKLRPDGVRFYMEKDDCMSFKEFWDLMRSKDFEKYAKFNEKYLESGEKRFLDGESISPQKVALNTYPRSGNTLARKFIENISGIYTGSGMTVPSPMPLQMAGHLGDGITDDTCWVIKAHYPNAPTNKYAFKCNK